MTVSPMLSCVIGVPSSSMGRTLPELQVLGLGNLYNYMCFPITLWKYPVYIMFEAIGLVCETN